MIGVVVAAHGDMARGLVSAVELISGKHSQIQTVGLCHEDGIEDFEVLLRKALHEVDSGDGVIGFVDILGGSPANIMLKCMRETSFPCISGVNLPVLLEAVINRESMSLEELANHCMEISSETFIKLEEAYKLAESTIDEEVF